MLLAVWLICNISFLHVAKVAVGFGDFMPLKTLFKATLIHKLTSVFGALELPIGLHLPHLQLWRPDISIFKSMQIDELISGVRN